MTDGGKRFPLTLALIATGTVGAVATVVVSLLPTTLWRPGVSQVSRSVPVDVLRSFEPSGWLGDGGSGTLFVKLDVASHDRVRLSGGEGVTKIAYKPGLRGWAGMYWQFPANNWGDKPGMRIEGASKVRFWACGESGGEVLEFKVGGIRDPGKAFRDTMEASTGRVVLGTQWREFQIGLQGRDLSNVIGGFAWIAAQSENPGGVTFYLDGVRYE